MKVSNLDHTADAGVEIIALTLEELFKASADAMYKIINCPVDLPASGRVTIELNEASPELLLVTFLNELNYYILTHYTRLQLNDSLSIKQQTDGYYLRCNALKNQLTQTQYEDLVELKAVTYHQLTIDRKNDGYHTRLIFDL